MMLNEFINALASEGAMQSEIKVLTQQTIFRTICGLYTNRHFDSIVGDGLDRHHRMAKWCLNAAKDPNSILCRLTKRVWRENYRRRSKIYEQIADLKLQLVDLED